MTTATAENRHSMTAELMDAWLASYKTAAWTQDQLEQLAGSWMNQARSMRNDGQKVFEVLVTQAKQNADEMTRTAEGAMNQAMARVPGWDAVTMNDLRRQVADLNARVEATGTKL